MAAKFPFVIVIAIAIAFVTGCSSNSNPITSQGSQSEIDSIPVIEMVASGSTFDAIGLLGAYEMIISPDGTDIQLISKRSSAIGESYIVNGIKFFTMTPCSDCLKIDTVELTAESMLKINFTIRHPFDEGDPLKPPTAINRLDLDVFDMALLVHPLDVTASLFPLTNSISVYDGYVVNSTGYTTELANVIDDEAALPYILVVDDNLAETNTFNEFPMGSECEFSLLLDFEGVLVFDLYLTMGYGASATKSIRLVPQYFNPEFNKKSPWKVIVDPPNGDNLPDFNNTWNELDDSTLFDVTIQVFDWQMGANVNPALENPDDVYASSEISKVSLEIPGMHNVLLETTTADSGTGAPDDPLLYTLSLANENQLGAGDYTGLVKVTDERMPGQVAAGGETDTMADSIDGINIEWVNIPEFATYQTFTATVVEIIAIDVETPNGGEVWAMNSSQSITWSGGDAFDNVRIEYSTDDFVNSTEITPSTENDYLFTWDPIPNDISDTVKVRILSTDFPQFYDDSDDYFEIAPGLAEMIVFAADGPGSGRQIYTIDPEGLTTPVQWSWSSEIFNECPKLSPCGQYILYTAAGFSAAYIRIIDVTTGTETNINPPGVNGVYGDFSNDGTKVVTAASMPWYAAKELWTVDYEGNNAVQLTTGDDAWAPEYNFDDSKIVYQNFGDSQLYIYDVASGTTAQYTNNGTWNDQPHFSPDGTQVTWATMYNMSTGRHIWVSPVTLWNPPDYALEYETYLRAPCFSPDGTKIIYDHSAMAGSELAIYDISTTNWNNITANAWGDYQADWGYMVPVD